MIFPSIDTTWISCDIVCNFHPLHISIPPMRTMAYVSSVYSALNTSAEALWVSLTTLPSKDCYHPNSQVGTRNLRQAPQLAGRERGLSLCKTDLNSHPPSNRFQEINGFLCGISSWQVATSMKSRRFSEGLPRAGEGFWEITFAKSTISCSVYIFVQRSQQKGISFRQQWLLLKLALGAPVHFS